MYKYRYILSLCFIFIFSLNSFAQSGEIEEIITTATKTEKTLQEVPVAVSVISADEIDKANVVDAFDLMQVVPSLDTRQYQSSKNAAFFIRGFGNGSNNNGVEPSVALFVDGVYRSKMQSRISDLPMVERVEVLRGPQSTLFGKNASAGVINIITKKPIKPDKNLIDGDQNLYKNSLITHNPIETPNRSKPIPISSPNLPLNIE